MIIKKANINDVDNNLLNIFVDGYKIHFENRPDKFNNKTNSELKEELLNYIKNENVLITILDEKIVGLVIFKIKENYSKTLWIEQLVVDKDFRGKGIAKFLMSKIYEFAKLENCNKVELCCWNFNNNANDMYKHFGFTEQRVILEKEI